MNSYGQKGFDSVFKYNDLVTVFIQFLLILYIGRLGPKVPVTITYLFNNPYYRLFVFTIIFMYAKVNFTTSVLMSLAFIMTMQVVSDNAIMEQLDDVGGSSLTDGMIVAPSANLAQVEVQSDLNVPAFVQTVTTSPETIVIKPTLDDQGNATVPNVVIAPIAVVDSQGKTSTLEANVSVIKQNDNIGAPLVPSGPLNLQSLPVPDPVPAVLAAPVSGVVGAKTDINEEVVSKFASKVIDEIRATSGSCYPNRRVDMANVVGADTQLSVGDFTQSK